MLFPARIGNAAQKFCGDSEAGSLPQPPSKGDSSSKEGRGETDMAIGNQVGARAGLPIRERGKIDSKTIPEYGIKKPEKARL